MESTTTTDREPASRSILRSSRLWRRPEGAARGELVWNASGTVETVEIAGEAPATEPAPSYDATAVLDAEIEGRRRIAVEELDAELAARRLEIQRSVEQERAEALARIAEVERLEIEAVRKRSDAIEHAVLTEQSRLISERVDALVASQLGDVKQRAAEGDARLRAHLEARRREEIARLEEWRASERERIAAELAADERRFNDRLLRQLQEFDAQLAERMRIQQERLAQAWPAAEEQVRARLDALFDEALRTDPR